MIIRRRLRRLRERGLHRELEEVGCSMKYVVSEGSRGYLRAYEVTKRFLSAARVEEIWFVSFSVT